MSGEGTLRYLINDVFRHILDELSFQDLCNFRLTSPEIKLRVTLLKSGKFDTLYIKEIKQENCSEIMSTVKVAMTGTLPPKKLALSFALGLNSTMKQMLLQYSQSIRSLSFQVKENDTFLQQRSLVFVNLESLSLDARGCNNDEIKSVIEAILPNHAKRLNKLVVAGLNQDLSIPELPALNCLELVDVCSGAAWTLFQQSRLTLTSLISKKADLESPLSNNIDSTDSAVYKIPNLTYLCIMCSKAFNLILPNAGNLVSLNLCWIEDIPDLDNNIHWPNFPKLRELGITDERLMPIILQSRNTLERLELSTLDFEDNVNALQMPRLTDLHMFDARKNFLTEMLRLNHSSLEFLLLRGVSVSNIEIDDDKRMMKMRRVVLLEDDEDYTEEDKDMMTGLCPNAEVVILNLMKFSKIKEIIVNRCKIKNFETSLICLVP